MARTALTAQEITSAGLNPTMTAANAAGHSVPFSSALALLVRNADASPKVVTLPTPLDFDGLAVADRTVTVPAGQDRYIKPAASQVYRQADGTVYVDFDSVTSVTVALLKV